MRTGLHAVWSALRASWSLVSGLGRPRVRPGDAPRAHGLSLATALVLALAFGALTPASAQVTTSAQLNGAGSLTLPSLPAWSAPVTAPVTVKGWVYPRTHQSWARLVDLGNGQANNNIILAASTGTSGRPSFSVYSSGSIIVDLTFPSAIPLQAWTHLAAVLDSDRSVRVYVNGQLVASATATALPPSVSRTSSFIGRSNWSTNPLLDGSVADVRIWNTARTQAQIQAGMTLGSITGSTTGLVAAYPFGATGQAPLNDVSGNNRTLTASGAVTYQTAGPASPLPGPPDDVPVADLTGSGHLVMPSLPAMGAPITMEAWVYPRAVAFWGRLVEIAADGGTGASSLSLVTSGGTSRKPNFTVMSRDVSNPLSLDAPNPLSLNAWSHVAAVLDSD